MTDKGHYACPNGCKPEVDTPFYALTSCLSDGCELGILVYPDMELSNRWTDGVVGVPQEIMDWWHDDSCMPYCIDCNEEIVNVS